MYNAVVGPRIVVGAIEQWEYALEHNKYVRAPGPVHLARVGTFNQVHAEEMTAWDFVGDTYVRVTGLIE